MKNTEVFIEKIAEYDLEKILRFLRHTMEKIDFWKKLQNKKTILLKPNMLGAFKPEKAVTTHPVVIEALI